MGLSGVSPGSLIIIFLILFMMFGKSRMKELAEELAESIKVFKKTLDHDPASSNTPPSKPSDRQEAARPHDS